MDQSNGRLPTYEEEMGQLSQLLTPLSFNNHDDESIYNRRFQDIDWTNKSYDFYLQWKNTKKIEPFGHFILNNPRYKFYVEKRFLNLISQWPKNSNDPDTKKLIEDFSQKQPLSLIMSRVRTSSGRLFHLGSTWFMNLCDFLASAENFSLERLDLQHTNFDISKDLEPFLIKIAQLDLSIETIDLRFNWRVDRDEVQKVFVRNQALFESLKVSTIHLNNFDIDIGKPFKIKLQETYMEPRRLLPF